MKNLKIYTLLLVSAFVAFSCDEEDKLITDILTENPLPGETDFAGDAGSLDLSVYVSLGASITGGTMDNALYSHGQANSFPALLARQFAAEGGGAFNQPDINSVNGFSGVDGTTIGGKLILDLDLNNDGVLGDAGIVTSEGEVPGAYTGDKETLNNFGVPGIQTAQMLTPLTGGPDDVANPAYNALYARFASEPGVSTILGDAVARNPTFFTLWPGGNDVLGYATGGGVNEAILTAPATVSGSIDALLAGLMAGGAKGVIINVPNLFVLPFFQAVQYNGLALDEANATALNTGLAAYNGAVQGLVTATLLTQAQADARKVSYTPGDNAFLIEDDNTADFPDLGPLWDVLVGAAQMSAADRAALEPYRMCRQMAAGEFVTLSASTVINTTPTGFPETALYGLSLPLPDKYTLTGDEVKKISDNLTEINTKIATVAATTDGLAHFDALTVLQTIALSGGYNTGSFTLLPDFSPNGIFSNDGVHPNSRGSAILANEIIKVLGTEFGATIEPLDVMQFNSSPFQQ